MKMNEKNKILSISNEIQLNSEKMSVELVENMKHAII